MARILQRLIVGEPAGEYRSWLESIGALKADHDRGPSMLLELHIAGSEPGCSEITGLASKGVFATWHGGGGEPEYEKLLKTLSMHGRVAAGAEMGDEALEGVKALRAAASALDLKAVVLAYNDTGVNVAASVLGVDMDYVPYSNLLDLIREGIEYAPLYVDTYLSQYYSTDEIRQEDASRILGLYLAARSLLEYTGSNALLLDCARLSRYHPLTVAALMLDEGVPTACIEDYQGLIVQAVSIALTGRPAAMLFGGRLVTPTMVSSNTRLAETGMGLAPSGDISKGGAWVTVKDGRAYVTGARGAYWVPVDRLWPLQLSLIYLGYSVPGAIIPYEVALYIDGVKTGRIL